MNFCLFFWGVEKFLLDFQRILTVTAHVYNKPGFFPPHNLHILTLESGTVEINLAILGIDLFAYYVYI
jgi:hypothetical protein